MHKIRVVNSLLQNGLARRGDLCRLLSTSTSPYLSSSTPHIRPPMPHTERHEWSYLNALPTSRLVYKTVGQLVSEAARKWPDRDAIVCVDQNVRKTFAEVNAEAENLAAGLFALGLQPGDRLAVWAPNIYEWYLTQMAAAKAGLVLVNLSPAIQHHELKYYLNKVNTKALVSLDKFSVLDYYDIMGKVLPELKQGQKAGKFGFGEVPDLENVIMISEDKFPGTHSFKDIQMAGQAQGVEKVRALEYEIQADEPCDIQFTSGTTGQPKAATLSHHNVVNNLAEAGSLVRGGLDEAFHKICVFVPFFHTFGCVAGNIQSLINGYTVVVPSAGFDSKKILEAVEKERCTFIMGTPTMFIDILNAQRKHKHDVSSLQYGLFGAATCSPELFRNVRDELNIEKCGIGFGMTETSPVSLLTPVEADEESKATTVGYPMGNMELKIVDEKGRVVRTGVEGELMVRGYNVMKGYWGDEEKTKKDINKDGWLHTGDRLVMREDGYFVIVGRNKDMIIRGGENIFPREVEDFLFTHPDVDQVAICGVPDERLGEALCAWVKLKGGDGDEGTTATTTTDELREFCEGEIAHYKIPKYFMLVDSFPTTQTGKIQKFKMTEASIKKLGLKAK